jgi:hypothetical protein
MGGEHGGAVLPSFSVTLYVLLISYLALVFVPFAYFLVLACLHVVKSTSAYVLY